MICVFDCETVPDVGLIRQTLGIKEDGLRACEAAMAMQEEKTGSSFLPVPYHQVVSIAAVIADDFGRFLKVGCFPKGIENPDERELLESFVGFLNESHPKLISFNGRGFDLPMLFVRCLKYNLSCPAYFETDNPKYNKSKWENYRQRYSEQFHIDLLDSLGHYGAVRGLKLDVLCNLANIPGKYDVSGDQVMNLYFSDRREQIHEYCESDVLNTYWLYLKYELLKGNLTKAEYADLLEEFSVKIPADKGYSKIFIEFLSQEKASF